MEIYLTLSGFIFACLVALLYEYKIRLLKKQRNNVHFYVARDKGGILWLYMGKPVRRTSIFDSCPYGKLITYADKFSNYGLNANDFDNLEWADDPIEVFINLED